MKLNFIVVFKLLAMIVFLFVILSCKKESNKALKPNIIYILADDLGYGEIGSYGQTKIKTPNLDKLASQGMRFIQHYTGAPVCAPSRYMFLTGMHSGHAYIRGNYELGGFQDDKEGGQMPIPKNTMTVAKVLKKAGYQSAMIGKWGLGMNNTTGSPLLQGFDYYYGYLDQKQAHNYYPTHLWENDIWDSLPNSYVMVHKKTNLVGISEKFDQFKGKSFAPDKMLEKALEFIDSTSTEKPFFLYYPSPIPHVSLQIPDSLLGQYLNKFQETPYYGDKGYASHERPKSAYAAMISHLDYQVGEIWEAIKSKGIEKNTIILFSSDNGPTFNGGVDTNYFKSTGGLRGLKMDLYEGGIRIPFIAYWKDKISLGTISNLISGHWDMFNTFSELAGENNRTEDGISLVPELLGNGQTKKHSFIYFEFPEKRGQIALRIGDWKGIKIDIKTNPNASWELYNLKEDPKERNNLAEAYPGIISSIDSLQKKAHRHPHIREWEFIDPKFKK